MIRDGESFGIGVFVVGMLVFVAGVMLAATHRLGVVVAWVVTSIAPYGEIVTAGRAVVGAALIAVVALAVMKAPSRARIVVRTGPGHDAAAHEGNGHAAVGAGVRGTTSGIRARTYPDGSGWTEVPRGRLTLAEELAITGAGEYAAGPSGCSSDRARWRRDLRRAPRQHRGAIEREAHALIRRHVGNSFGRRVTRSLERTGKFR